MLKSSRIENFARLVLHRRALFTVVLVATAAPACTPFDTDAAFVGTVLPSGCDADIASLEAVTDASCSALAPFGDPVLVAGLPSGTDAPVSVGGVRLSPDYLTAYFYAAGLASGAPDDNLYGSSRCTPNASFTGPLNLLVGNGIDAIDENETDPTVSGDGTTLVFARGMPNPASPTHLYWARRQSPDPFTDVELLAGANDESANYDETPFLTEDGTVLYFASSRMPAQGSTDLYRATWDGDGTDAPIPVSELNTSADEIAPVVTPDDLTIYWASDRTDGNAQGGFDIWVASRASPADPFSAFANVTELNSPSLDQPTFVTRDGCTLYFTSDRDGGLAAYVATKTAP